MNDRIIQLQVIQGTTWDTIYALTEKGRIIRKRAGEPDMDQWKDITGTLPPKESTR